jgi:rhodanese-related sulfurtransferase
MKEAWSTTITGIMVLLLASVLSGWMLKVLSPETLRSEQVSLSRVSIEAGELGIPLVDLSEMQEIVASGSHLILDARSQAEYDQGHIPMAMSVPVKSFEESFPMIAPILQPDSPLVVYCSGPLCDDALLLIKRMQEAGFSNASLFLDGMGGWE